MAHSAAVAARGQQFGPLLQPLPGLPQLAGHAQPHSDHEGRRQEDADLAELHLLRVVVVACGPQDDQAHVAVVLFDLRPHVKVLRVLNRQLVQPEGLLDLGQLSLLRLEQPEPDEPALGAPGSGLLQRDRPLLLPAAVLVVSTINDHRVGSLPWRASARSRYTAWWSLSRGAAR